MFQYECYLSNMGCCSISNFVAGKIQRQQLLVLLCEIAKSRANVLCSDVSYATVSQ